jgi:hypothetical protein
MYCGAVLTKQNRTKEHVIGRRFVPKGKLNRQWNLMGWACRSCNNEKSDLEDDISAISMLPDAWGRFAIDDPALVEEAKRKAARSFSRRTRKVVEDSQEGLTVEMPLGSFAHINFNMVCPPQAETDRIFRLAQFQVRAFFYWITYDGKRNQGRFAQGDFYPIIDVLRADWGNPVKRAFVSAVANWDLRVCAIGADGFFKLVIRRHPDSPCWSWGVEWNHKIRVVGLFGERSTAVAVSSQLPQLRMMSLLEAPNQYLRYRTDEALSEEDDILFRLPSCFPSPTPQPSS